MHAVCATANICQADGRKQRRPLRKTCRSYFEGFLGGEGRRLGREATREEKYTSEKKKIKSAGSSEGRHGKILFHARQRRRAPRELRRCKNKAEREAQGVTWNRWNSEGRKEQPCGISGLFSLILNRPAQRERGRGSEVSDRLFDGARVGCITSLPLLQCLMAILHILDSAMVGHGIVSLGGFFTMCRVRVSRPHL